MRQRIRTTEQQRETVRQMKRALAERGLKLHPVSRRTRRHSLDFIAVPTFDYYNFIVVQPMPDGTIVVRSNWDSRLFHQLKAAFIDTKWSAPVIWSDRLLRKPYGKTEWWRLFFPYQIVKREYPVLLAASRKPKRRHRKESRP